MSDRPIYVQTVTSPALRIRNVEHPLLAKTPIARKSQKKATRRADISRVSTPSPSSRDSSYDPALVGRPRQPRIFRRRDATTARPPTTTRRDDATPPRRRRRDATTRRAARDGEGRRATRDDARRAIRRRRDRSGRIIARSIDRSIDSRRLIDRDAMMTARGASRARERGASDAWERAMAPNGAVEARRGGRGARSAGGRFDAKSASATDSETTTATAATKRATVDADDGDGANEAVRRVAEDHVRAMEALNDRVGWARAGRGSRGRRRRRDGSFERGTRGASCSRGGRTRRIR